MTIHSHEAEQLKRSQRLAEADPRLEGILTRENVQPQSPALFAEAEISVDNESVVMRDGIKLATDIYRPPLLPAPVVIARNPYGRRGLIVGFAMALARRGYVVVSQDCRGTGDSEPDVWDYFVYETEDGYDSVEWVSHQTWCDGLIFAFGSSYLGATQWGMATHPRMSAIAPEVVGLQMTRSTARKHMFVNMLPRAVGKGSRRISVDLKESERLFEQEILSTGYFNEPLRIPLNEALIEKYPTLRELLLSDAKRWVWARYCSSPPSERVELLRRLMGVSDFSYTEYCLLETVFDCLIPCGSHTIPSIGPAELCRRIKAPALIITSWFDWSVGDLLTSWALFRREATETVASRSRLLIAPSAHHFPGYREGESTHPELRHNHRINIDLLSRWYESVRDNTIDAWPRVIYYLMGANEWRVASDWPVPEARERAFYLGNEGSLSLRSPHEPSKPDQYIYDPADPTPTTGGSIVSFLYPAGALDVSSVQKRADVLTYTTDILEHDLDVVGPLRLILYATSSAVDTDFSARLSDVFPDGRAISLQSGILRTRYRNVEGDPELLQPGKVYRFNIDMWATANRFKAGHRLRLDISSADFPRFDRNTNRGGEHGPPLKAVQTIYRDPDHPSHLIVSVLGGKEIQRSDQGSVNRPPESRMTEN